MKSKLSLVLAATAAVALAPEASAQIRASEPATLHQTIDGTTFRIDYYRPRARGRSPIFGPDAVVWEHVWTPGANWATKLSFQKPIELEGVSIEPGTYSLWMDLDEETFMPKEFFLEPDTLIFHTMGPVPAPDQIRFPVTIEDAPFTELLTWDFEDLRTDGGTLTLRWGNKRFPFDIAVEPSQRRTTTEEEASMALGSWEGDFLDPEGNPAFTFTMTIERTDDGILHADWEDVTIMPMEAREFFNDLDMWLLPGGAEGWFIPAEAYDGVLRETWAGSFMEFELNGGLSDSFVIRDDIDVMIMRGRRVN